LTWCRKRTRNSNRQDRNSPGLNAITRARCPVFNFISLVPTSLKIGPVFVKPVLVTAMVSRLTKMMRLFLRFRVRSCDGVFRCLVIGPNHSVPRNTTVKFLGVGHYFNFHCVKIAPLCEIRFFFGCFSRSIRASIRDCLYGV